MLLPENLSSSGGLLMGVHSGGEGGGPLKTKRKDSGIGDTAEQPGPCGPWGVAGGHVAGGTGEYRVGDQLLTPRLRQRQQRWPQTETRPCSQGVKALGQLQMDSAPHLPPTNKHAPHRAKVLPVDKEKQQDPAMQSSPMLLCVASTNLAPSEPPSYRGGA